MSLKPFSVKLNQVTNSQTWFHSNQSRIVELAVIGHCLRWHKINNLIWLHRYSLLFITLICPMWCRYNKKTLLMTQIAQVTSPNNACLCCRMIPAPSIPTKVYTTLVPKFENHPLFADFGRKKHTFFKPKSLILRPNKTPIFKQNAIFS